MRNWDYRYTWIRDASVTLYALIRLRMTSETADFRAWLRDRVAAPTIPPSSRSYTASTAGGI